MTVPQDQFTKIAKQGQEAITGAVRTWADAVQRLSPAPGGAVPDVSAVVDSAFDLAERMLATQREFTKSVLSAYATGAGHLTDAVKDVGQAASGSSTPTDAPAANGTATPARA